MTYAAELDRRRMDELTMGLPSKSAKIRRLAAAGYARGDIARYIGVRYQFVYNVLKAQQLQAEREPGDESGGGSAAAAYSKGAGESPASSELTSHWVWTTVRKGGAVALPEAFLRAMGVSEGDQVQLALEKDEVRVLSRATVLRELQDEVRRYVPEGVSLVDELLIERRREAAKELRGGKDD